MDTMNAMLRTLIPATPRRESEDAFYARYARQRTLKELFRRGSK